MATISVCPTGELLQQFLNDALPPENSEELGRHIESCAQCQQTLHQLTTPENPETKPALIVSPAPSDTLNQLLIRFKSESADSLTTLPRPPDEILFPEPPTARGRLGKLGSYHIQQLVARGSIGILYRAYDERLERTVALKVLRQEWIAFGDAQLRFLREARAVSGLQHEHVVRIFDVGNTPGFPPYLVLEFVEGETLAARLQREGPLNAHDAATILAQVAKGLAAVHELGVIHRDIKPSNILLDKPTKRALITDFGLVRDMKVSDNLTVQGLLAGTPAYMSPEQIQNAHLAEVRSDVYSLGVVLYECLTGMVPFTGTLRMVLLQALNEEPRPPRRLNDKIPQDLENICLKALSKEPVRRYPTVTAFAEDLQAWLDGLPVTARPIGPWGRLWKWSRRNRNLAVVGASALWLLFSGALGASMTAWSLARAQQRMEAAVKDLKDNVTNAASQRDLALATVQKLIYEVEDRLEDDPAQQPLREELIQIALNAVRDFSKTTDNPTLADLNTAVTLMHLGEILDHLQRGQEALDQYRRAEVLFQGLRVIPDSAHDALTNLATLFWQRADLQRRLSGWQAAVPDYRNSLETLQRIVILDPAKKDSLQRLEQTYDLLLNVTSRPEELRDLEPLFEAGLNFHESMSRRYASNDLWKRSYFLMRSRQVFLAAMGGQYTRAKRLDDEVLAYFNQVAEDHKQDWERQADNAQARLRHLRLILQFSGKTAVPDDATRLLEELGQLRQTPQARDRASRILVQALLFLGELHLKEKDYSSSWFYLSEARDLMMESPNAETDDVRLQLLIVIIQRMREWAEQKPDQVFLETISQSLHQRLLQYRNLSSVQQSPEKLNWVKAALRALPSNTEGTRLPMP